MLKSTPVSIVGRPMRAMVRATRPENASLIPPRRRSSSMPTMKPSAVDAERRDGAPAEDHDRIQNQIEQDRPAKQHERRAGVTGAPEGGGHHEVAVDQHRAQELHHEKLAAQHGDLAGRLHEAEHGREREDSAHGHHDAEHEGHRERGAGGPRRARGVALAVAA
jgi:hypothetical protein